MNLIESVWEFLTGLFKKKDDHECCGGHGEDCCKPKSKHITRTEYILRTSNGVVVEKTKFVNGKIVECSDEEIMLIFDYDSPYADMDEWGEVDIEEDSIFDACLNPDCEDRDIKKEDFLKPAKGKKKVKKPKLEVEEVLITRDF